MKTIEEKYKEVLSLYAGLFEEVFENDEDTVHPDNYENYKLVSNELSKLGSKPSTSVLNRIEYIENQLPY